MKISLAQMNMSQDMEKNCELSQAFIYHASERNSDLILFPETQLTRFFAKYKRSELVEKFGIDIPDFCIDENSSYFKRIVETAKDAEIYVSPNFYTNDGNSCFDTSYLIGKNGEKLGQCEMVHIANAENFYEKDYYTPSDDGFKVFDTEFGKIAIVICFDRHFPESIRSCALMGAELILIPTANLTTEPLDIFEAEIRTQSYQNNVFIAMCNRCGKEDMVEFAGESIIVSPDGDIIKKADSDPQMLSAEIDLDDARKSSEKRNYISIRRKDMYKNLV